MKPGKRLGKVGFQQCLAELISKIISLGLSSQLLGSSGGSASHAGFLLEVINVLLVDLGVVGAKGDVVLLSAEYDSSSSSSLLSSLSLSWL